MIIKICPQRKAIELIPPLAVIVKALPDTDVYERYGKAIDLLHWVLIRLRDPYIKSLNKESVSSLVDNCANHSNLTISNSITHGCFYRSLTLY